MKLFNIISESTTHDDTTSYSVTVKDDLITLKPVNLVGETWTQKGLNGINTLKNTGNGLEITLDKKKIKLNYSDQHELSILFKLYEKECDQEYTLLKTEKY